MNNDTLPISKEGWNYIGYSIAIFILFVILHLDILSFIALAFIAFFAYIYRNPERELSPFGEGNVVSPSDGTVVYVENLVDSEYAYRVEIDSRCLDVGFLRTPLNATVVDIEMVYGTKLPTSSDLFSKLNESTTITFVDDNKNRLQIKHLSKVSFDDLKMDIVADQKVAISSRYGFMMNGLTSIYLPKNFKLDIRAGSKVIASKTLIGSFK